MNLLNIKYALTPAIESLSLLLFANLITTANVFKKSFSLENIRRLQIKHFYTRYVLTSLATIVFAFVLEIFSSLENNKILLGGWGALLLISFIYNFKAVLLLLDMVFGNDNTFKNEERGKE